MKKEVTQIKLFDQEGPLMVVGNADTLCVRWHEAYMYNQLFDVYIIQSYWDDKEMESIWEVSRLPTFINPKMVVSIQPKDYMINVDERN